MCTNSFLLFKWANDIDLQFHLIVFKSFRSSTNLKKDDTVPEWLRNRKSNMDLF